jgi:hypothetical protein
MEVICHYLLVLPYASRGRGVIIGMQLCSAYAVCASVPLGFLTLQGLGFFGTSCSAADILQQGVKDSQVGWSAHKTIFILQARTWLDYD